MKTNKVIVLCIILIIAETFLYVGCATIPLSQTQGVSKLAVIQISANATVTWSDEEKEGDEGLFGDIQKIAKGAEAAAEGKDVLEVLKEADHSTLNVLNESEEVIFKHLKKSVPFVILPKETLIGNEEFQNAEEQEPIIKLLGDVALNYADGYKGIFTTDPAKNTALVKRLSDSLGVEALLVTDISFEQDMSFGIGETGSLQGVVTCYATLYDKTGKNVW
ncbi:MAG: hypothetical protein JSV25_02105 [Spirochaetota bacterium]|nr:MAG: hypothetical protein JSV25_02105 [Spirochaetota bacterium]